MKFLSAALFCALAGATTASDQHGANMDAATIAATFRDMATKIDRLERKLDATERKLEAATADHFSRQLQMSVGGKKSGSSMQCLANTEDCDTIETLASCLEDPKAENMDCDALQKAITGAPFTSTGPTTVCDPERILMNEFDTVCGGDEPITVTMSVVQDVDTFSYQLPTGYFEVKDVTVALGDFDNCGDVICKEDPLCVAAFWRKDGANSGFCKIFHASEDASAGQETFICGVGDDGLEACAASNTQIWWVRCDECDEM